MNGSDLRKQFEKAGFEITDTAAGAASMEVRKDSCSQALVRDSSGTWRAAGPPRFMVRGVKCELEDRGYQKFWYHDGKRFPIKRHDLTILHQFDEEVRALLGLKSLYNESLGTTCARSIYDRLNGRPE